MGRLRLSRPISQAKKLTFNNTLTSGVTKTAETIVDTSSYRQWGDIATHNYISEFNVNSLTVAVTGDAALALGEHVATFPDGLILPKYAWVELNSITSGTVTGTAGEVGLGTTIASGAAATLGGTVAFGNIMDGTTISNHVAATTLTSVKANLPDLTGTKATHGVMILDGASTAKKIHLNIASTWANAGNLTFSAKVRIAWTWVGSGDDE